MESNTSLYHERLLNEVLFAVADLGVPALLVVTGAAALLDAVAREVFGWKRPAARTAFVWIGFVVANLAASLPLRWLRLHALEHDYGVSWQDSATWLRLELLGNLTWALFNGVAMVAAMHLARSGRRGWWAGALAAYVTCTFLLWAVVTPAIEPFTRAEAPLTDAPLITGITALAARAGLDPPDVLVVGTSEHGTGANAYSASYFVRPRIVLDDNLLLQLDTDEMLQVAAHELGHHALHHAWLALLFDVATTAAGVALLIAAWRWLRRRYGERWRIRELTSPAAVPLVIFFLFATEIAAQPLSLALQRRWERQADEYAIRLSPNTRACRTMMAKLAESEAPLHWLDPYLLGTHPSYAERVASCDPPPKV